MSIPIALALVGALLVPAGALQVTKDAEPVGNGLETEGQVIADDPDPFSAIGDGPDPVDPLTLLMSVTFDLTSDRYFICLTQLDAPLALADGCTLITAEGH